MTSCNSLYLALLVVNWLKEARRDHFGLIVGSSGYQKPSFFIERVIMFKHFVVFASSASKSPKKVLKRIPKPTKTHRRGPQERPGVSWRRPRRPPNHPQSAPRASLALREASGSHFQALLTSFSIAKETKKSPSTEQTEGPRSQAHASNTHAHASTRSLGLNAPALQCPHHVLRPPVLPVVYAHVRVGARHVRMCMRVRACVYVCVRARVCV